MYRKRVDSCSVSVPASANLFMPFLPTAVFCFLISALGVTAGAHRLWSHRSYKASLPLKIFLGLANSMSFQVHTHTHTVPARIIAAFITAQRPRCVRSVCVMSVFTGTHRMISMSGLETTGFTINIRRLMPTRTTPSGASSSLTSAGWWCANTPMSSRRGKSWSSMTWRLTKL